eukprot:TRINITY_DN500_c5_g1_i1.p1 TRINITY_DN500_c5_g1~~TRINITY_DN500_c5_g1_i1.p1  ORF type:complete len:529 (+),score=138.88 TRINITY_DN500_c5_g1_i1:151-1737(+)
MNFEDTYDDDLLDGDMPQMRIEDYEVDEDDVDQSRYVASAQSIPEVVKQFVTYLNRYIKEKNVYEIFSMYENNFNKIAERFYKNSPWPSAEMIGPIVNQDPAFILLYKELYYRHIYTRLQPTLEQRLESWKNYSDIFHWLQKSGSDLAIDLPSQWLWDMIDEFIFQFQSFCQFRSKLRSKNADEINTLKNNPQAWNIVSVLGYLQSLVKRAHTLKYLENPQNLKQEDLAVASHPMFKKLGYFCMVGLVRVHCLIGDYRTALKTIAPYETSSHKSEFPQVIACHVTLNYYLAFVYMMLRRYTDAIRTLTAVLLYISRTKQYTSKSQQSEQIGKKTEQMYALLSICLVLCPQRVDENIHSTLKEKNGDKTIKMQRGDETTFEELFSFACPKFITPAALELGSENPTDALKNQIRLFMMEIKEQDLVPTIRSYLKLYTSIPSAKLSNFLNLDPSAFNSQLMCFKHKTLELGYMGGDLVDGEWIKAGDVDFKLENDMVTVVDTRVPRRYSDFFIRHIQKFNELSGQLDGSHA